MKSIVIMLFRAALLVSAFALASTAAAQATYPTAASGVRAPGTVPLQCDAGGANCAPVSASNPLPATGNVASGATDAGNPVKVGGVASSATAPGTVSDGQRQNMLVNGIGAVFIAGSSNGNAGTDAVANIVSVLPRQQNTLTGLAVLSSGTYGFNGTSWDRVRGDTNGLVVQPALSSTFWSYAAASGGIVSSTADVAVKAAAGASVRNYVCAIDIAHDALGAATEIVLKDGSTVLWRSKLQTALVDGAAGAGAIVFNPCLRGTANTAVNVAAVTSVTGGIFVNLRGYTGS